MPLRNLPIKTGHLFLGLAAIMFIVTVAIFSGQKSAAPVAKATKVKVLTQNIVVPLVPVSEGKTLSMNDVTSVKWPSEFLPKGSTFSDPYELVGRVAKQDLFPGEPIFAEKVSGSNTRGGLPAVIPPGMRAVSVAVTEVKGVAGFVKPGDRVDVLSTFQVSKSGERDSDKTQVIRTVLQNVLVLASAQTMVEDNKYDMTTPDGVTRGETSATAAAEEGEKDGKGKVKKETKDENQEKQAREKEAKMRAKEKKDAEKAARLVSSVTLALTPEQTETLALAEETGDLRLSLRSESDHGTAEVHGVDFDQLINSGSGGSGAMPALPKIPAAPALPSLPVGNQVEFIQGTEKSTLNL